MKNLTTLIVFMLCCTLTFAQDALKLFQDHLEKERNKYELTVDDISDVHVSSMYTSKRSGVTHIYVDQTYDGIPVFNATANANVLKDGRILSAHIDFVSNIKNKVSNNSATLSAEDAALKVAHSLGLSITSLTEKENKGDQIQTTIFENESIALEPIKTSLRYFPNEDDVRLTWVVEFYELGAQHNWFILVDAATGEFLYKRDQVIHCDFGSPALAANDECIAFENRKITHKHHNHSHANESLIGGYKVFALPAESPNHGPHIMVTDPDDAVASPWGWHDINGDGMADYTITRGNNVHAYEDTNNSDSSAGNEPDGGASLTFDTPFDPNGTPGANRDAAVVNLFYVCNMMHDIWYRHGFDEAAGNFQQNNNGNGGSAGDYIRAEAQDGSGTNNANFSSGGDGSTARIQMYLWTGGGGSSNLLTINSPASIEGPYGSVAASFGAPLPTSPLTEDLVLVDDGSASSSLGCGALVNGNELSGKIALVDRGDCEFGAKALNAENAGAIATIICNNNAGEGPVGMAPGADGNSVNIPVIMISKEDCDIIKVELGNGVNGTIQADQGNVNDRDGDFDNGIICHEYGHGLSIRMVGGPNNGGCLGNDEQMGEGWSDWVGLMLTIEEGDTRSDVRGIGTFAIDQPTTGVGIRPAPYSTNFATNGFTYADSNDPNISVPHGVGFIWATALWEMTWDLIDEYGFDPNFHTGTGGNNIAMTLVTEGMKMLNCNPGMVNGRDAILDADEVIFDGEYRCLIWEAFARRGLGFGADQGSSASRSDQTEAFDLPPLCLTPEAEPTAEFTVNATTSCSGQFYFTDASTDIPQDWSWDFGDGNTSTSQNPVHTYTADGTYDVTLTVTNTLGTDSYNLTVMVDLLENPTFESVDPICEGTSVTLTADGEGDINWYLFGTNVFTGSTFTTPPLSGNTTYQIESAIQGPIIFGGPEDGSFATGGYHNTGFTGTSIFEAYAPFTLISAWVDAGNAGNRLIELFNENGQQIAAVNVFMPAGQSRVTLNLEIPGPGIYSVGGTSINLFRNDAGADYPYQVGDVATITSSSATTAPLDFFYYLYDWEVREVSCVSDLVNVPVTIIDGPNANFTFTDNGLTFDFMDASTGATSWSWDFGDGTTSTEQNPSHEYAEFNNYVVTLTVSDGTCENTFTQTIDLASSTYHLPNVESLELLPNIGEGQFTLQLELAEAEKVNINVFNTVGKKVYSQNQGTVAKINQFVDLGEAPAAAYIVQIQVGEQSTYRRYILVMGE